MSKIIFTETFENNVYTANLSAKVGEYDIENYCKVDYNEEGFSQVKTDQEQIKQYAIQGMIQSFYDQMDKIKNLFIPKP